MASSRSATDALTSMWEGVEAVPELQTGVLTKTRVGDWELMRMLGEGEFAKVQSCRRAGDSTIYACKHISKARLVCASNIKRTLRRVRRVGTEITAMRSLNHKSICCVLDVIHTPEYVHVIMENGGRDLYEVIGDREGVSTLMATTVAHTMCCALAHCIDHGVIHRDIKPENVLVRTSFNDPQAVETVKVCDFGLCAIAPPVLSVSERLARREAAATLGAADAPGKSEVRQSPNTVLETGDAATGDAAPMGVVERNWVLSDFSGSPGFVAPEIVTEESYDGRYIDAWSLGCVVLELVLGHGTFDSTWMNAYAHDTMADRAAFKSALASAVVLLRKLPEFSPAGAPPPSGVRAGLAKAPEGEAAAAVDGLAPTPPKRPMLSPLGDFVLSLLEVEPKARLEVHKARHHPWLAEIEAQEAALAAGPPAAAS